MWNYDGKSEVTTENLSYIPRFQSLCEQFKIAPVYLCNYETLNDSAFCAYINDKVKSGLCEVGIHIHAWNNPPHYELCTQYNGNPYLIEYPYEIMRFKFAETYNLIHKRFGIKPISHRAGRWVMNEDYFKILEDFDIKVDCSYTPCVSWMNSPGATIPHGCDYENVPDSSHMVGSILEVPMTIRKFRTFFGRTFKSLIKNSLIPKLVWLRPATNGITELKNLVDRVCLRSDGADYAELMLHSSELMPGGSPYFTDEKSIDTLYEDLSALFKHVTKRGFQPVTLNEYFKIKGSE